jgi:hypothetical protein
MKSETASLRKRLAEWAAELSEHLEHPSKSATSATTKLWNRSGTVGTLCQPTDGLEQGCPDCGTEKAEAFAVLRSEGANVPMFQATTIPFGLRSELLEIQRHRPEGVSVAAWQGAISDAVTLLRQWGDALVDFGWGAPELFGLHPSAPMSRVDFMGAVWLIKGQPVTEITEDRIALAKGLKIRKAKTRSITSRPAKT